MYYVKQLKEIIQQYYVKMSISKGHIYIITCCVNPKIYYIGSTYDKLKQRWNNHKMKYKVK